MTEDQKKLIIETIEDARLGKIDEDFEMDLLTMDNENDKTLDITLLKVMGDIEKTEFPGARYVNGSWRWEWKAISHGEYPLEKLPDHVRDLAQVLYYQNSSKKTA